MTQILTLLLLVWGKSHRPKLPKATYPAISQKVKPMLGYSVLSDLLRPRPTTDRTVSILQQQVLLPRTAADELPPYREQPWIIDKRGYRKNRSKHDVCSREQAVSSRLRPLPAYRLCLSLAQRRGFGLLVSPPTCAAPVIKRPGISPGLTLDDSTHMLGN